MRALAWWILISNLVVLLIICYIPVVLGALIGCFALGVLYMTLHRYMRYNELLWGNVEIAICVTRKSGKLLYANSYYFDLAKKIARTNNYDPEAVFYAYPGIGSIIHSMLQELNSGISSTKRCINLNYDNQFNKFEITLSYIKETKKLIWHLVPLKSHDNLPSSVDWLGYVEDAPIGFFSANHEGRVLYINRTLKQWVGYDKKISDLRHLFGNNVSSKILGDNFVVFDANLSAENKPVRLIIKRLPTEITAAVVEANSLISAMDCGTLGLENQPGNDGQAGMQDSPQDSPIGFAILDENSKVIRHNHAFDSTLGVGDMTGKNLADLVASDSKEQLASCLKKVLAGEKNLAPIDVSLVDSSKHSFKIFFGSKYHNDKIPIYLIDNTTQHNMEVQFAQSMKMQAVNTMTAGIAHDFNNDLQVILSGCDNITMSMRESDPHYADIVAIRNRVLRSAALVKQLLAFSRQQTLRPDIIDLNQELAEIAYSVNRLLGEKIHFITEFGRNLYPVKVDKTQLTQVIINLAANARDVMPDGGKLILRTKNVPQSDLNNFGYEIMLDKDYVLIEVADTGFGMKEEVRSKIFEPFFTTKDIGKGTGLGLSTVYGIVKQSGGYIFAESEYGKGTVFRIFLAREEQKGDEAAQKPQPQPAVEEKIEHQPAHGVILLVEDEYAVRKLTAKALALRGYKIIEADNGLSALERFEQQRFDLIISDVKMPEMDGTTLYERIRAMNQENPPKFIFVSGYSEEIGFVESNPEVKYISKPYSIQELAKTITELLSQKDA